MADNPFYRFFRRVSFQLDLKLWQKMPRHPSFKHEYFNGKLHWTPRPNTCDVYLDLDRWQSPQPGERLRRTEHPPTLRHLQEGDWEKLPRVFCAGFCQWPPLSQWQGPARLRAARCILDWTRLEKDGPLVLPACFVAMDRDRFSTSHEEAIAGAIIVTLVPVAHLRGAPATEGEHLPHLDWIFVPWVEQRHGIATLLLAAVVHQLRVLGHKTLASTVLTGNPPAMLWHWSSGFRLPRGQ
jgi:hypothetical protein